MGAEIVDREATQSEEEEWIGIEFFGEQVVDPSNMLTGIRIIWAIARGGELLLAGGQER